MSFVEEFHEKVVNAQITLEDVRLYTEQAGIALAHASDGFMSLVHTKEEMDGLGIESRKLTDVSVGGDLILINWLVKSAIEYSDTARMGRSRGRAENMRLMAINMLSLAELEMQRIFVGTTDNLSEYLKKVSKPLPAEGWLFD